MKGYVGRRELSGTNVYVITEKKNGALEREPLKHLVLHSPTGLEWGYNGSGPADLALSILADHFGENPTKRELQQGRRNIPDQEREKAKTQEEVDQMWNDAALKCWRYHQEFKALFVAKMKDDWSLDQKEIQLWVEAQETKETPR